MKDIDLSEVVAVVYDPIRGNMLTTRSVLHGIGFRRIDGINSISALRRRLKQSDICVLLLEATEELGEIVELLQSIRLGEIKTNPFLPIIGTLWSGYGEAVAGLMNAGADDVVLRPFSVNKVEERIFNIIENRREFVVTSDYVGPDRGVPIGGIIKPVPFCVPNALRNAVIEHNLDPVEQAELLEEAKRRICKERLAKLARRIAMAAEVTIQANSKKSANQGFVSDLIETSAELVKTARAMNLEEVHDIAEVLENVVEKTAHEPENRLENAELARQLSLAIYVAYAVDDNDEFKKELDKILQMVRGRLENARQRMKRKAELSKSIAPVDQIEPVSKEPANMEKADKLKEQKVTKMHEAGAVDKIHIKRANY